LHILVRSDNMSAVSAINKGTSCSIELLGLIQELFWLSVKYSFKLTASFLPGRCVLSDAISQLHVAESSVAAQKLLSNDKTLESSGHLSYATYVWLQEQWGMN
jgi:hypothetical protein